MPSCRVCSIWSAGSRCSTAASARLRAISSFSASGQAVERVKQFDLDGTRKGGVIWHTQGSGKSLTMVMLGRALALDRDIKNPRLIIVTDRDDLDKQIKGTFKSCEMEPSARDDRSAT